MKNHQCFHHFQQTVAYLLLTVAYAVASTLVFQAHSEYNSMPKSKSNAWTVNQLLVTSVRLLLLSIHFDSMSC